MVKEAATLGPLDAKRRGLLPQVMARLVLGALFALVWGLLWLVRMPMPVPFLLNLLAYIAFFLLYWKLVQMLPREDWITVSFYGVLAVDIVFYTVAVYFLGGISYLGAFAYVFGLIFSNSFLDLRRGFIYTSGASLAFTGLILLEATSVVPHYAYLEQGPLRYADPQFVATTIIAGAFGVFFCIYGWVNWVGHQVRNERDGALLAQGDLLEARADLRTANDELEGRVAERTSELERTNVALRESEERLRTVVSNAPVILFALDRDGIFTLAEGSGLDAFRVKPEKLVGRSVFDLYHDAPEIQDGIRRALAGEDVTMTAPRSGLVFEAKLTPIWGPGGISGVIGVATDMTERSRAESELQLLFHITQAVAEAPDFTSCLATVVSKVCETIDWPYGEVWVPNAQGDAMQCSPAWYSANADVQPFRDASERIVFAPGRGLIGRAWLAQQPFWIQDVTAVSPDTFIRSNEATSAGLRAALAVPIVADGGVIAVLSFLGVEPRPEDPRMVQLVSAVAAQLGWAVQRKQAEVALRESEERFRKIFDEGPLGMAIVGRDLRPARANATLCAMLGYEPAELARLTFAEITHPEDVEADLDLARRVFSGELPFYKIEKRYIKKNGDILWGSLTATAIRDQAGNIVSGLGMLEDVTERKHAEDALRLSESKFRTMAETVAVAVFIYHGDKIRYVNSAAEELTGYSRGELLQMNFWDPIHPDLKDIVRERGLARQQHGEAPPRYEVKLLTKHGQERWVDFTAGLIDFEGKPSVLGTAFDVTQRKIAEAALQEAASRDSLTGLLNRGAGVAAIEERFAQAVRSGDRFSILVLDLDRFKLINDDYDHQTGDAALQQFARVMVELTGESGVVCRLGGDEFEIGLHGASLERALMFGQQVHSALRSALDSNRGTPRPCFTVSIGIACYPDDGADTEELSRRADHAMYAAKAEGGARSRAWRHVPATRAA